MDRVFQYRKRYEVTCDRTVRLFCQFINSFQYRKRYEVTCDKALEVAKETDIARFNTASGMRSHVTRMRATGRMLRRTFQYRKRYEVTCDQTETTEEDPVTEFQYRKRYEVTCDVENVMRERDRIERFNTASGMRSHVTLDLAIENRKMGLFQYRKRYEVTCDTAIFERMPGSRATFQYRKRYEVTCDENPRGGGVV